MLYVPLSAVDDFNYDPAETFDIQIAGASNAIMSAATMTGTVTIIDDEAKPKLFVADVTVSEGETLSFTVTTDVPSELPVVFDYATVDGLAKSPADFGAISGTVTFAALVQSQIFNVVSVEESLDEFDETFTFTLSSLNGVDPGDVGAVGTILNDDTPPVLSVSDLTILEGETGVLVVSLSVVSGRDVIFDFASSSGANVNPLLNAVSGTDFTGVSMTSVTIPEGSTTYSIDLVTIEDLIDELDEGFTVSIANVIYASTAQVVSSVTITDDDLPPQVFIADHTVVEGQTLAFTVSLSAPTGL